MSLSAIAGLASLAFKAGPAVIRGVSQLFGGSEVADEVADIVEQADKLLLSPQDKQKAIENELSKLPPEDLVELQALKVEMEKQVTRQQEVAAQDRQSEHHETQTTIRHGDSSSYWVVRCTRPLMALISTCSGCYYIITNPQPELTVAGVLFGLGATYMGIRHREKDKGLTL
ncbi:hypothetical protein [Vibrio sp. LaRot3]|uniref:hypothetical protein n=1 Tax=Vibrio sp. LaRot3 TaxID=2998829 RepID=UPI0022CDF0F2|nr:hypothetical protein [Vibrio sp. LaRot3]MDA0148839.1 hypothetical protein [Vibrio sp. LaRot3]